MRTSTPKEAADLASDAMGWLRNIRSARDLTELSHFAKEAKKGLDAGRACHAIRAHFRDAIAEEEQRHAETPRRATRKDLAAGETA